MVFQSAFSNIRLYQVSNCVEEQWAIQRQTRCTLGSCSCTTNQFQLMCFLLVLIGIEVNTLSEGKQSSWQWLMAGNHFQSFCFHYIPKAGSSPASSPEFHSSTQWLSPEPSPSQSLPHTHRKTTQGIFLPCVSRQEFSLNICQVKEKFNFPVLQNTPMNYYQVEIHVIKVGGRRELNYDKTHAY